MRILITGVAGFLGSRFADWVLKNVPGVEVYGVDDLSCGYNENVPEGVKWDKMDISQGLTIGVSVDYVFHFAAYAAEGLSPFIRAYNYTNNLVATANVVNYCLNLGVKRLVFTSSMAVYGRLPYDDRYGLADPPFHEDLLCSPIDPYGIAKYACEQDIQCAGEQHGLDWCIIRPHNLYGPGQSIWQKYRNVLGVWMARGFSDLPILVYGDGTQRRAFSYIDDCLPCLWQASVAPQASKEIINLGGTCPTSINTIAQYVAKGMDLNATIEYAPARYEVKDAWCTVDKSIEILGYEEKVPLTEGIYEMLKWARDAWKAYPERRIQNPMPCELEVTRGLYPYWKS